MTTNGAATTRDGWGIHIMQKCEICGSSFEKCHIRQVLCGDRECLRRKKLENGKDWRDRHPDYMRGYMAAYRALPGEREFRRACV